MNIPGSEKRLDASPLRKCFKCDKIGNNWSEIHDDGREHGKPNYCQRDQCQDILQSYLINQGLDHVICNNKKRKIDDLPTELLQLILVNTVVEEVKDLKLAKASWEYEVKRIIRRLKKVSCSWSRTFETSYFCSQVERKLKDIAIVSPSLRLVMEMNLTLKGLLDERNVAFRGGMLFMYQYWASKSDETNDKLYQYRLSVIRCVRDSHFETVTEKTYETRWDPIGIIAAFSNNNSFANCLIVGGSDETVYKINLGTYRLSSWQPYSKLKQLSSSNCGKMLALQATDRKCEYIMNIHKSDLTLLHSIRIMHQLSFEQPFFFSLNPQGNIIFSHRFIEDCQAIVIYEVDKKGQHIEKDFAKGLTVIQEHQYIDFGVGFSNNAHLLVTNAVETNSLIVYDMRLNELASIPTRVFYTCVVCCENNLIILIERHSMALYRLNYQ